MTRQVRRFLLVGCALALPGVSSFAQSAERGLARAGSQAAESAQSSLPAPAQLGAVAAEIGLLRKSLQALNAGLRDIDAKVFDA
jgi:hypothetical protein